tara:strand:- start:3350 stop:4054 length:705 start_codon:yes stop_codon:yes gene_type:complete
MNQIISQHGWGFDSNIWIELKDKFINENWIWQNNERGYFSEKSSDYAWEKYQSGESFRLVICHSLGTHLIDRNTLNNATHVVLINSFNSFIPQNNERRITIKTLKKMERKINDKEIKSMLKEFFYKSFMPNPININYESRFSNITQKINIHKLLNDFQKLYYEDFSNNLFHNNIEVLIIKSKNDLILNDFSSEQLIRSLNNSQINKPKLIELEKQGHLPINIDLIKIIEKWLKK